MSVLDSLNLRPSDPVTKLWGQVAEYLPTEESQAACSEIGKEMRDAWCCINIACLKNPAYAAEDIVELIEAKGGKKAWLKTLEFIVGHTYHSRQQRGVPPSACLIPSGSSSDSSRRPSTPRIICINDDKQEAEIKLPLAKIIDAVKETPDYKTEKLTYKDTKAVMKEVYLWEATQMCTVASSQVRADTVGQMLYDLGLRPWGKKTWAKKIINREQNGRRSNAKVDSPAQPSTPPTRLTAVLPVAQSVYRDMKVNMGDIGDAARSLIDQGLFIEVDEEADEKTYSYDDMPVEEEVEEEAGTWVVASGEKQQQEPPRPAARDRTAAEKAAELVVIRERLTAANSMLGLIGDAPPPPFQGSKPQPLTTVVEAACGGRKRKRGGKSKPLSDVTNTNGTEESAALKKATSKQAAPKKAAPKKAVPRKAVQVSGVAKHPSANEIRLRKLATTAEEEDVFTDEFLDNGTAIVVIKTEQAQGGVEFSLVKVKRSRTMGYVKSAYLELDPVVPPAAESDSESDFSVMSEGEGERAHTCTCARTHAHSHARTRAFKCTLMCSRVQMHLLVAALRIRGGGHL